MKRTQLNLALVAVVAALGVAVYFAQEKEEQGPPLVALSSDDITRIAIEHPGVPTIRLQKDADGWKLTEPVQAATDTLEVSALVGLASREAKLTLDPSEVALSELGLDPPQYSITINDVKLEFGEVEPLNYRRYVKTGDKIVLIEDPPSAALDKDYSDLVSKSVIPEGAKIEKIVLPDLTVARGEGDQGWTLTPAQPEAGSDAPQKLVDAWKNARAMWTGALPEGAEPAKAEPVTVTLAGGQELKFRVVERDPQFVLERPDLKVRYTLSKALTEEMLKLPEPEPQPEAPAEVGETPTETEP